jgi:L-lactate dehydrogenase complex protein LldF
MDVKTKDFVSGSKAAILDPQIQEALAKLRNGLGRGPRLASEELTPPVWQDMRQRASDIKTHTIANLDYYLEKLSDNVEKAGGHVHFARDAKEASDIVLDIARKRDVELVIKGKSMVSEELEINDHLESIGIESVETDLGEYILQLMNEPPFHIIAPAIHKSRRQVSEIFTEKLKTLPSDEVEQLCETARETLREKFLNADMGITGVNFAVAETGTIALVTNEGNGRMCTSLPKVHIALMGMEKILPRLEDLALFLGVLPRSATGQRISSYVTCVTGPRRSTDEDGPEEFHLVIVDNGRSKILADEQMREALNCIRCGACLNACPIYGKVGGHAYGWVYSGPIGAIVTPMLTGTVEAKHLPFASTLCGACKDACPVKIDIPHMLLRLRQEITQGGTLAKNGKAPWYEAALMKGWRQSVRGSRMFSLANRLGRLALLPLSRNGKVRRLPPPLSGWTRFRDFPLPSAKPFRERWRKGLKDE